MQLVIFFYLYLILHTCVQRFDVMGERENLLGLHEKWTHSQIFLIQSIAGTKKIPPGECIQGLFDTLARRPGCTQLQLSLSLWRPEPTIGPGRIHAKSILSPGSGETRSPFVSWRPASLKWSCAPSSYLPAAVKRSPSSSWTSGWSSGDAPRDLVGEGVVGEDERAQVLELEQRRRDPTGEVVLAEVDVVRPTTSTPFFF
jgi:hypothetical protein